MNNRTAVRPSGVDLVSARHELTVFVTARAVEAKSVVGFGWTPSSGAPSTYVALREAYRQSEQDGVPLPVSDQNLDSSLLLTEQADYALRFWHDVNHVRMGLTFKTVDELDLALWHVAVAKASRLSPLAIELLDADMVGQTLLYASIKGFARNQFEFDLDVLMFGVADAIVLEKERQELAAA